MKSKLYGLCVFILIPLIADDRHEKGLLNKISKYQGRHTFLLSYPRSGNTWLRYCLEYLTGRPTMHRFNIKDKRNCPIGWLAGFEVDCSKPPIEKVHCKKEIDRSKHDPDNDLLIVIVRNPKEALSRQLGQEITLPLLKKRGGGYDAKTYFDNLATYDSWKSENRILIYYEDLLTKPKETLACLLLFLNESLEYLDCFMNEYEAHKIHAIEIYKESKSDVTDLLYHSKLIDVDHRRQIDEWIAQLYPAMWDTYLKDRYVEDILDYSII